MTSEAVQQVDSGVSTASVEQAAAWDLSRPDSQGGP
jgi:hypothetical protein